MDVTEAMFNIPKSSLELNNYEFGTKKMAGVCTNHLLLFIIYVQWRIQDLAQGGDKSGAKRPKNFLSPP